MKKSLLYFILLIQFQGFTQQQSGKPDSLQDHFQSLANAKNSNDNFSIIKEANDLGDYYFSREDTVNALQYYETAFATAKKIKNHLLMGESLNNIAEVYQYQSNYKKSANVYSRAIEMYTLASDENEIAATLNRLGKVTALSGNYKQSYKIYEKANSKSRKINFQEAIVESYGGMSEALRKLGRAKYAAHYDKLYQTEKANLDKVGETQKVLEVQPIPDAKKTTTTAAIPQKITNSAAHSSVSFDKQYLIFVPLFLLTILIIVVWFKKSIRDLKKSIAADQAARDTLLQDRFNTLLGIRDDLHSDLSIINSLNNSIGTTKNLDDLQDKCKSVQNTTQKMNENIDDIIWALNSHNITIATLLTDIHEYTANYFAVYPLQIVFDFPDHPSKILITKESYRALFVAIKETYHYIAKFSGATEVTVRAGITEDYFSVSIIDNGEDFGFDTATSKADSIANMEARFEKIGGKFTLFSKPAHGSHTTIGLPLRKIANDY